MLVWTVPRDWCGERVAIIIGGGPSAADVSPELLRGRKVVVVNSSYERFPFADLLFFGDRQWWEHHQERLRSFAGDIVTTVDIDCERVKRLNNCRPNKGIIGSRTLPPLSVSFDRTAVPCRRTSMVPAANIAVLRGVRALVWLGLDGKPAADGRSCHHLPHPASFGTPTLTKWKTQLDHDLTGFAASLEAHGVKVINASPGSAVPLWPIMPLAEALAVIEQEKVAA